MPVQHKQADELLCHGHVRNIEQNGRVEENDWSGGTNIKYEKDVEKKRYQKLDVLVEVQQNKQRHAHQKCGEASGAGGVAGSVVIRLCVESGQRKSHR